MAKGSCSSLDFIGRLRTANILDRVDPRRPNEIVNELLDDYKATIESFGSRYTEKVLAFAEHISNCHQNYQRFEAERSPTERMIEVRGFAYLTLDNTYTSIKLLMLGYLTPSGNMLRQSLEAACMCILLATDTSIVIGGKKGEIRFFEEYRRRKPFTRSHRAVEHVKRNTDALDINSEAIARFVTGKQFYDKYSHPSKMSMASRLTGQDGDSWLIGGHFDETRMQIYDKEFSERVNFAEILPSFIETIFSRAKG